MINLKLRRALLASTIVAGAQLLVAPAFAQVEGPSQEEDVTAGVVESPDDQQADVDSTAGDPANITVVTGSLISNNLNQAVPVISVGAEAVALRQLNTAEEILRDLPGFVPNIGSAVNNGNGGSSYADLYGLGSFRNIVVLDGRRLASSDAVGRVDLNNIPQFLMKRVDVLTGGASTTYGADAMAGVVNYVMDNTFTGLRAEAAEQISQRGDSNTYRIDLATGAELEDGRGNVVFAIGHQRSKPLYQSDRKFSNEAIDSFDGSSGGSSTSVPARFSFQGGGRDLTDPLRISGAKQLRTDIGGVTQTSTFAPFNFNPYNVLKTPFKRWNIYGAGRYEITDEVEAYVRGLYSNNRVETIVAPSGAFGVSSVIPLSNPYMPTLLRNQFCANNDFNSSLSGIQPLTQAQCDAAALATNPNDPNFRSVTTTVQRRNVEGGPRISSYDTNFYDVMGGLRGKVINDISWDVSGSYGQSHKLETVKGYWLNSRVRNALNATSKTECLGSDAACVPLNIFGDQGTITSAMTNYLTETSRREDRTNQIQVLGTISGGTGYALPWAETDVSMAVGGGYRRERASFNADQLAKSGDLGGAGGATPDIKGAYNVYEAYGELSLPVIEGRKWAESLVINGGVRYSRYKVNAENAPKYHTTTWKADLEWKPINPLMFRANIARAVRAPNIFELFSPQNTVLQTLQVDPCAGSAPVGNANLRAVCLAQGAQAFSIGSINNPTSAQANATTGGNLRLKPEKGNSWGAGAVLNLRKYNLSLTADYYYIKIKKAITNPTVGDVMDACFANLSASSASSTACTSIRRNPDTGGLDGDTNTVKGLPLFLSNAGRLQTDGVNLSANWRQKIMEKLMFHYSVTGNWTNRSKFRATPTSVNRECVGRYSADCSFTGSLQPEWNFSQRFTVAADRWSLTLTHRWIDKMKYEPLAREATGDPLPKNARIKAHSYFDLSAKVSPVDRVELFFVVQNLTDKKPPFVGSSVGDVAYNNGNTYPSTYDALGRMFKVSARFSY